MKRDMELVREIMFAAEKMPAGSHAPIAIEGFDDQIVGHQVKLLIDDAFLEGTFDRDLSGVMDAFVSGITMKGYDFIDASRDNTIWQRAIAYVEEHGVEEHGGAMTIGALMDVLKDLVKKNLGL
jgi:hypothetical protein